VQKKSLGVVNADLTHTLKYLRPINEFGNSLNPKDERDIDKAAYGSIVKRIIDDIANEAAINLK